MSYGASIYSHVYNPSITTAYLERRYAALEKEIENALQHGPTDHLTIANLVCRKLIVAEEIKHNRRLVELIRRTQAGVRPSPCREPDAA
jgi:hypothetical protein